MKRIIVFDYMRGLMALWVLLDHGLHLSGISKVPSAISFLKNSGRAVDVFIALSGFVIFYLIHVSKPSYREFIVRRWFRIYPVYLVGLILAVCALPLVPALFQAIPFDSPAMQAREWTRYHEDIGYFWQHLGAHLVLMHGAIPSTILPGSAAALLPPGWSLSLEFQFYLVAPLLIALLMRGGWVLGLVVAVIGALFLATFSLPYFDPGALLFQNLPVFLIGMGAAYLITRETLPPRTVPVLWALLAAIVLVYALQDFIPVRPVHTMVGRYGLPFAIFTFGLILSLSAKVPNLPWLAHLGDISYSVYILHYPVMLAALYLTRGLWIGESRYWLFWWIMVPTMLGIVLLISRFSYTYLELPLIRFGRRIASRETATTKE